MNEAFCQIVPCCYLWHIKSHRVRVAIGNMKHLDCAQAILTKYRPVIEIGRLEIEWCTTLGME